MLEKPNLPDEKLLSCLRGAFGLTVCGVEFLPLGADQNTAVYRAVGEDGTRYFVKLRSGVFDEIPVLIPKLLHEQGVEQVIVPVATPSGRLWTRLDGFTVTLYPFVQGHDAYEVNLSDAQWREFGRALKGVHSAEVPAALAARIPRETYSARWRDLVRGFLAQVEASGFADPVAAAMAAYMRAKRAEITHMIDRAQQLAAVLEAQASAFVLCHADIHAGNLLLDAAGALYLVDWDTALFAPKERDLMFVGGALCGAGHSADEEERLFYQGYGETEIDYVALAYYRYERIVQDIAAFGEEILRSRAGADDRERGLGYFKSNFLPNGVLAMAYRTEAFLPPELRSVSRPPH